MFYFDILSTTCVEAPLQIACEGRYGETRRTPTHFRSPIYYIYIISITMKIIEYGRYVPWNQITYLTLKYNSVKSNKLNKVYKTQSDE